MFVLICPSQYGGHILDMDIKLQRIGRFNTFCNIDDINNLSYLFNSHWLQLLYIFITFHCIQYVQSHFSCDA